MEILEVGEIEENQAEIVVSEKNELAVQPEPTIMNIIANAVQSGSIEMAERMLAMKERIDAKEAERAFNRAFAKFQADCPIIEKTKPVYKKGSTTEVKYYYASLDKIVEQVKKPLAENGLSYTMNTRQENEKLISIIELTHVAGHKKVSEFGAKIEGEYMSALQQSGNTRTYLNRYNLTNILGIMTGDPDNDGAGAEVEYFTYEDGIYYAADIQLIRNCTTIDQLSTAWKTIYKKYHNDKIGRTILTKEKDKKKKDLHIAKEEQELAK